MSGKELTTQFVAAGAIGVLLALLRPAGVRAIVVGTDNRVSTSKTTVFGWTLVLVYGLLALLAAKLLGDPEGWEAQLDAGLQEEYVLLLGGPYAAAIIAKVTAVTQAAADGRPPAAPGSSSAAQLVSDDSGAIDLGDLQYVLFNLIALAIFLGEFWGDPGEGFPELPPLLTGLVLTSAGGYAAKKLIGQAGPALTSVVPPSAAPGTAGLLVYGTNLVVGAAGSPTGEALLPIVSLRGRALEVTAHDQILGADRLAVALPADVAAGGTTISVVRADGQPALGPAGADGLPFTVT